MSSKDLKIRFDSQFCRINCQIFSWLLSSGARGGSCRRYVAGDLEVLGTVPVGLIEDEDCVSACGNSCSDLIKMKLHGFGVAER